MLACHFEFRKMLPLLPLPVERGATMDPSLARTRSGRKVKRWLLGSMPKQLPASTLCFQSW